MAKRATDVADDDDDDDDVNAEAVAPTSTPAADAKKVERQDKQLTFDGCVTRAFKCMRHSSGQEAQAEQGNINLTGHWTPLMDAA